MKFIHTADIHLGAQPEKGHPLSSTREQEIWDSFARLLAVVRQEKTDLLLIAGDLFHRQPLKRELRKIDDGFRELSGTEVVFMAGNHDYIGNRSYYKDFKWSSHVHFLDSDSLERVYLEQLNTYVYGLSYYSREIRESLYDLARPGIEDGTHILLAHGGDDRHIPISWNQLEGAGFTYVALGHIHKPQVIQNQKIIYPGALEPLDRNDIGSHGYITGTIDEKGVRTSFVPFAKREYVNLDIRINQSMSQRFVEEKVAEQIRRRGEENFYSIRLVGERREDRVYDVTPMKQPSCVLAAEDHTRPVIDYEGLYEEYQGTILGEYIATFRSQGKLPTEGTIEGKALCYGVQALLDLLP